MKAGPLRMSRTKIQKEEEGNQEDENGVQGQRERRKNTWGTVNESTFWMAQRNE